MIPAGYVDHECYGKAYTDPEIRALHEGHKSGVDCYRLTWDEPPLPWVQRQARGGPKRLDGSRPWMRTWHLAIGIRKDTGNVQVDCNVGNGPGPFRWREVPVLNWRQEPGQWFCRRCVARWTEGVYSVTVRMEGIKVTKAQLKKLHDAIKVDAVSIELRHTDIEDTPALIAIVSYEDQRDTWVERLLLAGDGVVKL